MQKFLFFLFFCLLASALTGQPGVTASPPGLVLAFGGVVAVLSGGSIMVSPTVGLSAASPLALGLLFVGTGWLSSFNSLDGFLSRTGLSSWTAGLGLLAACLYAVQSRADWRRVAWGVLGLAMLSTLYGLAMSLSQGVVLQANFTNPDCYSVIPLTGILLSLGLLPGADKRERLALMICVTVLSSALFLTASRAGLVGLLAGMAVFSGLAWRKERARQSLMVLVCAPLITILFLFALGKSDALVAKWAALTSGKEPMSVEVRLAVLKGSGQASLVRPGLGYGPGTFHLAYQSFRPPLLQEGYMNVAHNDFAQVLVEQGYLGLLLWTALLGVCLHRAYRACRFLNSVEHGGACAATAGILAYSVGNFALPVTADLLFLLAVIGLCASVRSERRCPPSLRLVLGGGLLIVGTLGCMGGVQVVLNNHRLQEALRLEEDLHWEAAYEVLKPSEPSGDVRIFIERARLAERVALFLGDMGWNDAAVAELEAGLQRSPNDLRILLRLAELYESQGRNADAATLLRFAQTQSKDNAVVDESVERNLILQGDAIGAAKQILSSPKKNPAVLGELLALLEAKEPGAGLKLLSDWGTARPGNVVVDAARSAGVAAEKLQKPSVALAFYNQVLANRPNDALALLASIPLSLPADRLPLARRALEVPDVDANVRHQAMRAWVELMVASKGGRPVPEVMSRLEGYLTKNPAVPDLRIQLSKFYEAEGQIAEARRVLRDGLDQDPGGTVHAHLGGIYERNGSPDIAVNYYEEALRMQPGNEELRRTIEKLQAPKVNVDDPTKLRTSLRPKASNHE